MRLSRCPTDTDAEVLAVGVPDAAQLRLREVGIREGSTIRVTHLAPFGGRVLAVGASRIALDRATADLIDVSVPRAVR